jgi:hypothetical protein
VDTPFAGKLRIVSADSRIGFRANSQGGRDAGLGRRRFVVLALFTLAALLSASMLAPAFGAPRAVSAANLASKLASTLKIAKRADKNAKRAIAGLQSQGGQGGQGPAGPKGSTGPKGEKGDPGSASNTGATGATGPAGPAGPQGVKGDTGDACLPSNQACVGPQGTPGTPGTNGTNGTNGSNGTDGAPGPAGPSAINLNVNLANSNAQDVQVDTFALRFNCFGAAPNFRQFLLGVKGTGGAQLAGVKGIDDLPQNALPFSAGVGMSANSFTTIAGIGVNQPNPNATFPHFYRLGGTLVLHNNLRSATVVYDMFLDDRNNTGTCSFRGSAVLSGLL